MKTHIVFFINKNVIKFLRSTGGLKKTVCAMDVIDIQGQDDAAISQTLSDFVKKFKLSFRGSRVTLLLPRSWVMTRFLSLPSQKEDEIRAMIDLQLASHIPYAREEVDVDFRLLSKRPDGYARVAIVIMPHAMTRRTWKIFSDAKIPVDAMSISSIGLWSLYQQQSDIAETLGAIIDVDADESEICLCVKSHGLTSRQIPIGHQHMRQHGYAEFLKEWEMTQKSVDLQHDERLGLVYVTGGMNEALVGLHDALLKTSNPLKVKDLAQFDIKEVSMAALAGVALSSGPMGIDLTPQGIKKVKERRIYRRQLIVAGIWAAFSIMALALAFSAGFLQKNFQLVKLQHQIKTLEFPADLAEGQWQKIRDIEGALTARVGFSNIANELQRLLPPGILLVSMAITDGHTLSLEGTSINPQDINQFQKQMSGSIYFSHVSLDYVNKRSTPQGEVNYFKITCLMRPPVKSNEKTE